ncbi:pentatricopeptide repeat-containing protein, partial [Trifolium medium]|nr:pentatricopeptide repeat-containing protein [Trifolium medium]
SMDYVSISIARILGRSRNLDDRSESSLRKTAFTTSRLTEGHVQVFNVKFKAFKLAGRLQGADVVICLKEFISPLPMYADFSLFPNVKELQKHIVKIVDNWGDSLPTPLVEMYEAHSHVSWACGICDQIIVVASHGAGIHIVAKPYDLALRNTVIWGYGSKRNFVFYFNMMSWHTSFLVKQQGSIEFNFPMVVAAVNEVCWRMLSTFHRLLNFVFDRGKTPGMRIDVRKLRSFAALMRQVEVCQQRNCLGQIEKDIWSFKYFGEIVIHT